MHLTNLECIFVLILKVKIPYMAYRSQALFILLIKGSFYLDTKSLSGLESTWKRLDVSIIRTKFDLKVRTLYHFLASKHLEFFLIGLFLTHRGNVPFIVNRITLMSFFWFLVRLLMRIQERHISLDGAFLWCLRILNVIQKVVFLGFTNNTVGIYK